MSSAFKCLTVSKKLMIKLKEKIHHILCGYPNNADSTVNFVKRRKCVLSLKKKAEFSCCKFCSYFDTCDEVGVKSKLQYCKYYFTLDSQEGCCSL